MITVSHTSKENTYLRASLDERRISVIPNAIDATVLEPTCPRKVKKGQNRERNQGLGEDGILHGLTTGKGKEKWKISRPDKHESSSVQPESVKDSWEKTKKRLVIVVVSRMTYRKGADFLVHVIPKICQHYSHVDFLIGGDGPKLGELAQMRENYQLFDRVTLLGNVKHDNLQDVLTQVRV